MRESFFRWTVASVLSFALLLGVTVGLRELAGLAPKAAYAISIGIAVVVNFLSCRYYVYDARSDAIMPQFARFVIGVAGFRLAEFALFAVLTDWLQLWYALAVCAVTPVSFVVKYLIFEKAVFASATSRESGADKS